MRNDLVFEIGLSDLQDKLLLQSRRYRDSQHMTKHRLASWIVVQALESSLENISGFSIQDAHSEANDLADAVELVASLDGVTSEVEQMRAIVKDIRGVVEEMKAARDAALVAQGIDAAFNEGFELRRIGSVNQLYKRIPDLEDGHYVIDIGGGVDPTVNADMKDWGVTVNVETNGLRSYAVVVEKLNLADALRAYKELPLPVGGKLVQIVYNTWEEAGVDLSVSEFKP